MRLRKAWLNATLLSCHLPHPNIPNSVWSPVPSLAISWVSLLALARACVLTPVPVAVGGLMGLPCQGPEKQHEERRPWNWEGVRDLETPFTTRPHYDKHLAENMPSDLSRIRPRSHNTLRRRSETFKWLWPPRLPCLKVMVRTDLTQRLLFLAWLMALAPKQMAPMWKTRVMLRGKVHLQLTELFCCMCGGCEPHCPFRAEPPWQWMPHSKICMDGWFLATMSYYFRHVWGSHPAWKLWIVFYNNKKSLLDSWPDKLYCSIWCKICGQEDKLDR